MPLSLTARMPARTHGGHEAHTWIGPRFASHVAAASRGAAADGAGRRELRNHDGRRRATRFIRDLC